MGSQCGCLTLFKVCQKLLVNSLLRYHDSTAAVIDTTGNFDILRLYTLILAQLHSSHDSHSFQQSPNANSGLVLNDEDVAAKTLDRVKIMRVFDFEGVKEAICEIRDGLDNSTALPGNGEMTEDAFVEEVLPAAVIPPARIFVADSEDEDDSEDEEMLFDTEANRGDPESVIQEPSSSEKGKPKSSQQDQLPNHENSNHGTLKLILIDNLAQAISPLLKKDFVQGPLQPLSLPPF